MKAINESELHKKRLGDWVLNPYIGCEHGCFHCYCPAMPGVKFFNDGHSQEDWGKYLFEKPGFVDALKRQLKSFTPNKAKRTDWGNGWLLMSFLTDPYTPAEGELKITRQCLQLLLEAGHKVRLQTRSAMVERDFDLLRAHKDQVRLGTSLPYRDDSLARLLEPRATGPSRRLKMLENAADSGIPVYVAIAPVMPWTAFSEVWNIAYLASKMGATEIFCEVLNPKGSNLEMMAKALAPTNYIYEARQLLDYNEAAWAEKTYSLLHQLAPEFAAFIPWPDTSRRWAKHLTEVQSNWLKQFLPPKESQISNVKSQIGVSQ